MQTAAGDSDRFRSRDEGCRADASLEGLPHACVPARIRRARQADFTAALADAKAVINSGTYSLEPVFADLWCVARAGGSGSHGLLREHRLQRNHKEFIFTVQFGPNGVYDATHVDADNEYNYCTSSTSASTTTTASGSERRAI